MSMQAEYDRRRLVLLIDLYLVLLIVEGALRKWLLPSLSDPLLLVRDPVAIAICVLGYRSKNLVFDGLHALALPAVGGVCGDRCLAVDQRHRRLAARHRLRPAYLPPSPCRSPS